MQDRWLAAQEIEEARNLEADELKKRMHDRKQTWVRLLEVLRDDVPIDTCRRILDLGGGSTSIFLALNGGERYVVDPIIGYLFSRHPFLREAREYQGVHFVSQPIEEVALAPFDLVFVIITLDHVAELEPVICQIDRLLAPSGSLVVIHQCYASAAVRSIFRWFNIDPAHLHYFTAGDIINLFPGYRLVRRDDRIFEIYGSSDGWGTPIYRVDRLLIRRIRALKDEKRGLWFIVKCCIGYALAFVVTLLTRPERPLVGLKKHRLFVFRKP